MKKLAALISLLVLCSSAEAGLINGGIIGGSGGGGGGNVSIGTFGSTPNANGASASGSTVTLQPGDATHPGALSLGDQNIPKGNKTFSKTINPITSAPTNPVLTETSAYGNPFYVNGTVITYRIYSVKIVNTAVLSTTYLQTGSITIAHSPLSGGSGGGNVSMSWDADANAIYYMLYKSVNGAPYNLNEGIQTNDPLFVDSDSPGYASEVPNSYTFSTQIGYYDGVSSYYGLYAPLERASFNILDVQSQINFAGTPFYDGANINFPGSSIPFATNGAIYYTDGSPFYLYYGYISYPGGAGQLGDQGGNLYVQNILNGPSGGTVWSIDSQGRYLSTGSIGLGIVQTVYPGSTSGQATWSMPFQGNSYKKVMISLEALNDAGGVITFPLAFQQTPHIYGDTAALAGVTFTNSDLTLPVKAGVTGFIFVEGY